MKARRQLFFQSIELLMEVAFIPFINIHTLMQLSVPGNKQFGSPELRMFTAEKDKISLSKEITLAEKRKYEIIMKLGNKGESKPFTAPVFLNYREAIFGLFNQGVKGVFKGGITTLIYISTHNYWKSLIMYPLLLSDNVYNSFSEVSYKSKFIYIFSSIYMVDSFLHPIHTMNARFILQNPLKGFRTYEGFRRFYDSTKRRDYFQGYSLVLPKSIIRSLFLLALASSNQQIGTIYLAKIISDVFLYPILTIQRRLQCQSPLIGMIPFRYSSPKHAFKLILNEEGIKGLYRGFSVFVFIECLSLFLMTSFVKRNNDFKNRDQ